MYPAVQHLITQVEQHLSPRHADLARLFATCYPNTLETTTELLDDDTTFVFTGDIPAMWLRDSSAQVRPYIHLADGDPDIRRLVCGLIRRQAFYLSIDPYANAFNKEPNDAGHHADRTAMNAWLWERKYELDSLCYPVQLCKDYWDATGDKSLFDPAIHQMFPHRHCHNAYRTAPRRAFGLQFRARRHALADGYSDQWRAWHACRIHWHGVVGLPA